MNFLLPPFSLQSTKGIFLSTPFAKKPIRKHFVRQQVIAFIDRLQPSHTCFRKSPQAGRVTMNRILYSYISVTGMFVLTCESDK